MIFHGLIVNVEEQISDDNAVFIRAVEDRSELLEIHLSREYWVMVYAPKPTEKAQCHSLDYECDYECGSRVTRCVLCRMGLKQAHGRVGVLARYL